MMIVSTLSVVRFVTVPGVSDVSRYRVGFKSNERIVAHVDRRNHGVTAELP